MQSTHTTLEGRGKRNSRSNRPGRLKAGSIASIRLVAPMITISPRLSSPSMRARRVETMEEWIWSWRLERTGARPSISSKKMMAGLIWYAWGGGAHMYIMLDNCTNILLFIQGGFIYNTHTYMYMYLQSITCTGIVRIISPWAISLTSALNRGWAYNTY